MVKVEDQNVVEEEDSGICEDGSMMCTKHPNNHNNNNPGGICAVCLQEKLGNLVSSSLPIATFPPSSSSSSYRSESSHSQNRTFGHSLSTNNAHQRKPRIPFLSTRNVSANETLHRSKSTAATSFPDGQSQQRRRSFWSFLYYSRRGGLSSAISNSNRVGVSSGTTRASSVRRGSTIVIAEEEDDDDEENSPRPAPRNHTHDKVSRSRSVGCGGGSRSFSGDFFERLGDCTIRRVESQRQSTSSSNMTSDQHHKASGIKERVRCGGIFGGFNLTSESANSGTGRMNDASASSSSMAVTTGQPVHGRSRSWAWTLASPLRAFAKPPTPTSTSTSTSTSTTTSSSSNNHNNLPPSLLSVSG